MSGSTGCSVKFSWRGDVVAISKEVTGGDATVLFMAETAKQLMDQFVPVDTGALRGSVSICMSGVQAVSVSYGTVYARKQYEGVSYRHSVGGTTAFWDRTMMQVCGGALLSAVAGRISARVR